MVRPEGVWLSTDHRLTVGTRTVDDESPKQVAFECPAWPGGPPASGPRVLMGFVGLAKLPDRTPMIQWVRETLRGESRVIMEALNLLRDRLDRDVGQSPFWQSELIFGAGILEQGGKRFFAEISNVNPRTRAVSRQFELRIVDVPGVFVGMGGSGANKVSARSRPAGSTGDNSTEPMGGPSRIARCGKSSGGRAY